MRMPLLPSLGLLSMVALVSTADDDQSGQTVFHTPCAQGGAMWFGGEYTNEEEKCFKFAQSGFGVRFNT